jgi:hypothetical protein
MPEDTQHRKVGVAIVGVGGAVATTAIAGVELLRRETSQPDGLPLARVAITGLCRYEDLVFGGWDINGQNLGEALAEHRVLNDRQRAEVSRARSTSSLAKLCLSCLLPKCYWNKCPIDQQLLCGRQWNHG